MWAGKEELQAKWYDHQLGLGQLPGLKYRSDQVRKFLEEQVLNGLRSTVHEITHLLDSDLQDRALGKMKESADPALIDHYARRFVSVYDGLLDWAAIIRGASVPDEWKLMTEKTAQLADRPLEAGAAPPE